MSSSCATLIPPGASCTPLDNILRTGTYAHRSVPREESHPFCSSPPTATYLWPRSPCRYEHLRSSAPKPWRQTREPRLSRPALGNTLGHAHHILMQRRQGQGCQACCDAIQVGPTIVGICAEAQVFSATKCGEDRGQAARTNKGTR